MPAGKGFYSEDQEANFRAANVLYRRGGQLEQVCGARTRTGGACLGKPISGSTRCAKHAGPKAAREFRERQRQAYFAGRLSHEQWTRAEAKRAANRLRDRWKKDPWMPGCTIELGEREWTFRQESGLAHCPDPMPPAVLDWLRWKYRRLQIDRKCDQEWLRVLREELPKRLSKVGPANMEAMKLQEQERAAAVMKWHVVPPEQFSKRSALDRPSTPAPPKPRSLRGPGRPKRQAEPHPDQRQEIALFVHRHREVLGPMFERCREDEQTTIIEALRAFVADPNNRGVRDRWMRAVMAFGV